MFSHSPITKSGRIQKVLVTGANGQLGQGLSSHLESLYGKDNVLLSDLSPQSKRPLASQHTNYI